MWLSWLRTSCSRLRYYLFTKFRIGECLVAWPRWQWPARLSRPPETESRNVAIRYTNERTDLEIPVVSAAHSRLFGAFGVIVWAFKEENKVGRHQQGIYMPLQLDVERHHPEFKINVTFYRVVDFLGRNIASWSITSYSSKEPRFILQLAFIFWGYYPVCRLETFWVWGGQSFTKWGIA